MSPVQITCSGSEEEFLEQLQKHHKMMQMFQNTNICEFALGGVPIPCYDIKSDSILYKKALDAALKTSKSLDCKYLVTVLYLHLTCHMWSNGTEISDEHVSTHQQLLNYSNLQNSYTLKFAAQNSNKRKKDKEQSDKPNKELQDSDFVQLQKFEKESVNGELNRQILDICCKSLNEQLLEWFQGINMEDKIKCSKIETELKDWDTDGIKQEFQSKKSLFFQEMKIILQSKNINIEAESVKSTFFDANFFKLLVYNCTRFFKVVLSKRNHQ